jgi:hypothetical protein
MVHHPVFGHLFVFGSRFSIIAVRIDTQTTAWKEFTPNLDVFGLHQFNQVFHNDIDAIFVKRAVVSETEEV